jgi:hypothetical protein
VVASCCEREWWSVRVVVGASGGRCEWWSVRVVVGASGGGDRTWELVFPEGQCLQGLQLGQTNSQESDLKNRRKTTWNTTGDVPLLPA